MCSASSLYRQMYTVPTQVQKEFFSHTGASVVDINVTGNSLGADWDGSAGAANSSALAKGVWSVGRGAWEVLWSCQVVYYCAVTSKEQLCQLNTCEWHSRQLTMSDQAAV
jgi:hypothetical protein